MPRRIRILIAVGSGIYLAVLFLLTQQHWAIAALWTAMGLGFLDIYWPRFDLAGTTFARGTSRKRQVALTFDDGPNPETTPRILDHLRTFGAKGTFFVLGRHAEKYPQLIRKILDEGHEIGSHGFGHQKMAWMPPSRMEAQFHAWEGAVGLRPNPGEPLWFRPPYGLKSFLVRKVIKKLGYRLAGWSRGVWDSDQPGSQVIASRALRFLRPGEVILLHDGDGAGRNAQRIQTVDALPAILDGLRGRGLTAVTMTQLFDGYRVGNQLGRVTLGTITTLALVFAIARHVDWTQVLTHFSLVAPRFLVASLVLDLICLVLKSQAWRSLILSIGYVRRFNSLSIYLVGAMLNNLFPFRMGDIGRIDLLGRQEEIRRIHGFSTIALEAVLNGLTLLPILVLALVFSPLPPELTRIFLSFAGVVFLSWIAMFVLSKFSEKPWLAGFRAFNSRRMFWSAYGFLFLAWLVCLTSLFLMMKACGLHLSIWAAPSLAMALALSMLLPAAPGRLGAFEAAVVLALSLFGISMPQALAFGMILHLSQTLPTLLYGVVSWLYLLGRPHASNRPTARNL